MTIINMPANLPFKNVTWGLQTNTQTWISPLSGTAQTRELPGARWVATYQFAPSKRTERAALEVFLMQLRGSAGRFYAFNPVNDGLFGAGGGTPKVAGPNQTGSALVTDGWPASAAELTAGAEFPVGTERKRVTADVPADGAGIATINFEPVLRTSPADNADIVTDKPTCVMRLVDDNQVSVSQDVAGFAEISFSAVESFFDE